MGFSKAIDTLRQYRKKQRSALLSGGGTSWFTSAFDSVVEMLNVFNSDIENREIDSGYVSSPLDDRIPAHLKLDHVCSLRREVRKQYISGESDLYTDVTPLRYGASSSIEADLADDGLRVVVTRRR